MNDLLLYDQQPLNVVFDYGIFADVLLILMPMPFCFIALRTVVTRDETVDSNKSSFPLSIQFRKFNFNVKF